MQSSENRMIGITGHKATGCYAFLNEYLIETIDILASYVSDLFNTILDSGLIYSG